MSNSPILTPAERIAYTAGAKAMREACAREANYQGDRAALALQGGCDGGSLNRERIKAAKGLENAIRKVPVPQPTTEIDYHPVMISPEVIQAGKSAAATAGTNGHDSDGVIHAIIDAAVRTIIAQGGAMSADTMRNEILAILEEWKRPSVLQLNAGEMTAQEKRTVLAVLGGISRQIERVPEPARRPVREVTFNPAWPKPGEAGSSWSDPRVSKKWPGNYCFTCRYCKAIAVGEKRTPHCDPCEEARLAAVEASMITTV